MPPTRNRFIEDALHDIQSLTETTLRIHLTGRRCRRTQDSMTRLQQGLLLQQQRLSSQQLGLLVVQQRLQQQYHRLLASAEAEAQQRLPLLYCQLFESDG